MYSPGFRVRKLAGILRHARYRQALRKGVAAGVEHTVVLAPLRLKTVVDIGANRGQFSLVVRELFPEARIIAFEPLAEPASRFRQLFQDDTHSVLYPLAVGSEEQQQIMHVSAADDSSSLLPPGEEQLRLFPETREAETREVTVVPLDAIVQPDELEPPALLKIDVQGYEHEVLRGCQRLLPHFQYLYIEGSFLELYEGQALADELVCMLREAGFRWKGIYHTLYDAQGRCVQGDLLFERSPAIAQESEPLSGSA